MLLLPISSHASMISLGDTSDELKWGHLILDAYANSFAWAQSNFCRCIEVGLLRLRQLLPIASLVPINSQREAANELKGAHFIHCCCCRFAHLGPFILWEILMISSGGPIAAAADFLSWAHYFFKRYC